jgi:hypothetical protein
MPLARGLPRASCFAVPPQICPKNGTGLKIALGFGLMLALAWSPSSVFFRKTFLKMVYFFVYLALTKCWNFGIFAYFGCAP